MASVSDATVVAVRAQFEAREWRAASRYHDADTGRDVVHPAAWAVYDTESGIRVKYAGGETGACADAKRWNTGRVPQEFQQKAEAARELKKLLKPGDRASCILRHRSRSGMMRHISVLVDDPAGGMRDVTWLVARLLGDKIANDGGIKVPGCGMDMGFHLVSTLSGTLFPDGFGCIGQGCPSNSHVNGERDHTAHTGKRPHWHAHAGDYAIGCRWL